MDRCCVTCGKSLPKLSRSDRRYCHRNCQYKKRYQVHASACDLSPLRIQGVTPFAAPLWVRALRARGQDVAWPRTVREEKTA